MVASPNYSRGNYHLKINLNLQPSLQGKFMVGNHHFHPLEKLVVWSSRFEQIGVPSDPVITRMEVTFSTPSKVTFFEPPKRSRTEESQVFIQRLPRKLKVGTQKVDGFVHECLFPRVACWMFLLFENMLFPGVYQFSSLVCWMFERRPGPPRLENTAPTPTT